MFSWYILSYKNEKSSTILVAFSPRESWESPETPEQRSWFRSDICIVNFLLTFDILYLFLFFILSTLNR